MPGPCLQDAGDSLHIIGVADEVGAAPGWKVRGDGGLGGVVGRGLQGSPPPNPTLRAGW